MIGNGGGGCDEIGVIGSGGGGCDWQWWLV